MGSLLWQREKIFNKSEYSLQHLIGFCCCKNTYVSILEGSTRLTSINFVMVFSTLATGTVLAYNGNSDRGWNDPPTFAFSANKGNAKPKIDLRKRVSHQQALDGARTPPATQTLSYGVNNGTSEGSNIDSLCLPACLSVCVCFSFLSSSLSLSLSLSL